MSLTVLSYLVVGSSFALYIGIAFWSRALSTGDFYVAGKGVHPIANGMATAADWMSAASFMSMAGLIAFLGYDGSVYLMGWTGGYVLLALLLAPYLRKYGKFTIPEFIGDATTAHGPVVAVIRLGFVSFTTSPDRCAESASFRGFCRSTSKPAWSAWPWCCSMPVMA
jgi:cation/acetate symporter